MDAADVHVERFILRRDHEIRANGPQFAADFVASKKRRQLAAQFSAASVVRFVSAVYRPRRALRVK